MSATTTEIRERIEAILTSIDEIATVLENDEDEVADDALPAVLVYSRTATRARDNRDMRTVTRSFEILLYIEPVNNHDRHEQQAVIDNAEEWLDVIPDYFADKPRLELDSVPLAVREVGEMDDDGVQLHQRNQQVFTGILYRVEVTVLK